MKSLLPLALAGLVAIAGPGGAATPEPEGYRGEPYRAPVPDTLTGALVVDDDAAHALWATGRVPFVDVLPRPVRPADLPEDTLWRDPPHETIPGAIWLPNTGYERLDAGSLEYLLQGLAAATEDDTDAPVLFFCRAECWMSWNAAKRAIEHGYTRVFWYPQGTDGWVAQNRPLARVEPFPFAP